MAAQMNTASSSSLKDKTQAGFNSLAVGLKHATEEFDSHQTSDLFGFLKPAGDFLANAVQFTLGYAKRHPVRMGTTVAAIGIFAAQAFRPKV